MDIRIIIVLELLLMMGICTILIKGHMHAAERQSLRERARDMFYHGYNSYMKHAFPWDELKPISCEGRRWDRRERGDLDDTLGGFSLTLIDSLDMLAVVGDRDEFLRAVQLVIDTVHFDRDVTVSVFESTIRVIGGLISAHLIASPVHLGVLTEDEYDGGLLSLAVDLGRRLLPAFDTPTHIPFHRINLKRGIDAMAPTITCPAAAGSLLVEMAYLSRLSGNPIFEEKAHRAVVALWRRRSNLDLLGSSINVMSGEWQTSHVGIGAGLDSYFEYLLKYHLISGNSRWLDMFNTSYRAVEVHANHDDLHIEVDMNYGRQVIRSRRVSALQAFWPGLQVLAGEVSSAMRTHEKLFSLWNKFGAMPELFELTSLAENIRGTVISWARTSPLRPELIESTYHLYQATRDHKYLKIGRKLLEDIERVSRVECGYAAIGNIHTLAVEDRMDSYFLSETVKYLYLLFSDDVDVIIPAMRQPELVEKGETQSQDQCTDSIASRNAAVNNTRSSVWSRALKSSQVVFSTEGHVLMLDSRLFNRTNAHASHLKRSHACENGNALSKAQGTAAELTLSDYVRVGVAVRYRNGPHVMTLVASPATFGRLLGRFDSLEGRLLRNFGLVGDGCRKLEDKKILAQIQNRVVMVLRGVCSFAEKALMLQQSGASGVIIVNNSRKKKRSSKHRDRRYVMANDSRKTGDHVHIPVVMISNDDAWTFVQQIREDRRRRRRTTSSGDAEEKETEEDLVVTLSPWLH